MTHPLEALQETHWINFWETKSTNPKAPFVTLVLKDKKTQEATKYPVWRNKENRLFVGNPESVEEKRATDKPMENEDDFDTPPF